jgi:hypothetical protein
MDNVWLMGDYNTRKLRPAKVDANGTIVGTVAVSPGIFTTGSGTANGISGLVDLQHAPDGALYVVNLNCQGGVSSGDSHYSEPCTGIARIEYKGAACADTALHPVDFTTGFGANRNVERGVVDWVQIAANHFSVLTEGVHSIRILDVQGRVLSSSQGEGRKEYDFPKDLTANAAYFLEVKSGRGINVRGFILK